MVSRVGRLVKSNMSIVVRRIYVLAVLLCIFQQFNVFLTYSKHSLLLIAQDQNARSLTAAPITYTLLPSPSAKGGEKIETIWKTTESEDTLKIVNRIIVENENSSTGNQLLQANVPFDSNMAEDNVQRALVVICLGETATKSNYVERFVWSARNIGKFMGWIVLLTDAPEGRYENLGDDWTDTENEKFSILRPEEEHYIRHYAKGAAMVYKQFKTYVLQYLSKDPRLDEVSLVYYLDVDIVFGNPVWPLFHDLEKKYKIGGHSTITTTSRSNSSSVANMWMFEGNFKSSRIQGGQIILDRATSQPCLERFRSLMDPKTSTVDQLLLMQMLNDQNKATKKKDYSSLKCEIVTMPQKEKHILFPSETYIKDIANGKIDDNRPIPVLNHIKNTGKDLVRSSPEDLEVYLRYLFRFKGDQVDTFGITTKSYLDGGKKENAKKMKQYDVIVESTVSENEKQVVSRDDDNGLAFQHYESDELAFAQLKIGFPIVSNGERVTILKNRRQKKKKVDEYEDEIERAMFVISMGKKAAQTKTIERFVYSAREIGMYSGWIVVLTDAAPGRYDGMKDWTEKVIIMEPKEEDVKTHFNVSNMVYKRFKTQAIEYMDRDPRLDRVELIYYLDADIVFGDNMNKAFHGLETSYGIGRLGANSTNTTSLGRGKMWMFKGNSKKWLIQGGQIILDRYKSQPCLERWRKGFDEKETAEMGKDQYLLMAMKAEMDEARNATLHQSQSSNITALECEIVTMEQSPYIEFPAVTTIRRQSNLLKKQPNRHYDYSPMVHVRNDGGTATMKDKNIRPFMANLLRFGRRQKDHLGILRKVRMETT